MYKKILISYFLTISFAVTKTMHHEWPEPKTQLCLLAKLSKDILKRIYFFIAESDQVLKARVQEYDSPNDYYELSLNYNPNSLFSADGTHNVSTKILSVKNDLIYCISIKNLVTQSLLMEFTCSTEEYVVLGISNGGNYLILKKEEPVDHNGFKPLLRSVNFFLFNTLTEIKKEIVNYKVQYLDKCPYSIKFNLQQNKIGILNKIYDENGINGQSKFLEEYHEILIAPEHNSLQDYFAVFGICKNIENQRAYT